MSWRLLVLLWVVGEAAGAMQDDTARLLSHAKVLRGAPEISGAQYRAFHAEYLAWIDARAKDGNGADKMNAELGSAGLLQTSDDFFHSPAGYVHDVSIKRVRDLRVIDAGMYMGRGCSLDHTAILYQRDSGKRLGWINGDPSFEGYAYMLSGIDATGQLVATGWTISNCTSTWNGKLIRIDRMAAAGVENLLRRGLQAQDQEGENVAASVQGETVTFRYAGAVGDGVMLSCPSIARYRVVDRRVTREAPIALTRAGFLHEWLTMSDVEAARWSTLEAAHVHHAVAASFKDQLINWENVAQCARAVWEVTVRLSDSGEVHVFRIGGAKADELRMVGVARKGDASCRAVEGPDQIPTMGVNLPW